MANPAFTDLFVQHAMASYAKQLAFGDAIEDSGAWDLNLKAGTLSFADGQSFNISLLGSYGEGAGTWLWLWANSNMAVPPNVAAAADTMRELGRARDIPEFAEAQTHDAELFCHRLAMIAAGELEAGAYYRAPYDGGSAWLLINEALPPAPHRHDLARIQRVIAESISTFEMSHRPALEAYFTSEGLEVEETEPFEIVATAKDGDLRVRFDDEGRITEMKSLLRAATKPSGGFFNRLFRKD